MLRSSILVIFILPSLFLLSCGSLSYTQRTLRKERQALQAQVSTPAADKEQVTADSTINSLQKKEFKSREKPLENELILPDLAQDAGELITL